MLFSRFPSLFAAYKKPNTLVVKWCNNNASLCTLIAHLYVKAGIINAFNLKFKVVDVPSFVKMQPTKFGDLFMVWSVDQYDARS